jgi:hypothetical protein
MNQTSLGVVAVLAVTTLMVGTIGILQTVVAQSSNQNDNETSKTKTNTMVKSPGAAAAAGAAATVNTTVRPGEKVIQVQNAPGIQVQQYTKQFLTPCDKSESKKCSDNYNQASEVVDIGR